MKHLKSSLRDLRHIFERSLVARDLAEPLASFDANQSSEPVKTFMLREDYDVVGVRRDGLLTGYIERSALSSGLLGDHLLHFTEPLVLPEMAPIVLVLKHLTESSRVFLASKDHVWGIITRGDLQKAAFRMCLFGLISLLEMQLLRMIRHAYPDGAWRSLLSPGRLEAAEKILEDRRGRNEGTDLADCLQFEDKATVVAKSEPLCSHLGFDSRTKAEALFKDVKTLRDDLAHAQDILAGRWPGVAELAGRAENLLERCESFGLSDEKPA